MIKWTNLTHTVVLAVDGISVEDVESNPDLFSETLSIFEDGVEMANPALDGLTMAQSLAYVPLSIGATKRLMSGQLHKTNYDDNYQKCHIIMVFFSSNQQDSVQ